MDENLHYLHATLPTSDYRSEIARLNVEVQKLREESKRCELLQSLLEDMKLELIDVNGQLQQMQVTCNRLQDRDNYRDWCHRLIAHIKTFDPHYNPDREFIDDVAATEVPGKCSTD